MLPSSSSSPSAVAASSCCSRVTVAEGTLCTMRPGLRAMAGLPLLGLWSWRYSPEAPRAPHASSLPALLSGDAFGFFAFAFVLLFDSVLPSASLAYRSKIICICSCSFKIYSRAASSIPDLLSVPSFASTEPPAGMRAFGNLALVVLNELILIKLCGFKYRANYCSFIIYNYFQL